MTAVVFVQSEAEEVGGASAAGLAAAGAEPITQEETRSPCRGPPQPDRADRCVLAARLRWLACGVQAEREYAAADVVVVGVGVAVVVAVGADVVAY